MWDNQPNEPEAKKEQALFKQWGLPIEEIAHLGGRFYRFCEQFRWAMRTKTHDTSEDGVQYVSGLLRLAEKRNIAQMSRRIGVESQHMQQFISDSPWSGPGLIQAVQAQLKQHPVWDQGSVLVIDESADEKAGETSAGASRQHNGGLGKVDLCQVGVFAALVTPEVNTWIDLSLEP